MAQRTIKTCDRCKFESEYLEIIEVQLNQRNERRSFITVHQRAEWCENCCRELRLIRDTLTRTMNPSYVGPPTPPADLEEVIRELIRDELKKNEAA